MSDDQKKLDGQRAAVREHIKKYHDYPDQYDKDFALKTIRNAQKQIQGIRKHHPHWAYSREDDWDPN